MSQINYFKPQFVELMPPTLNHGILYVSTTYSLMVHLCACGCGEKVTLPMHPKQWRFTYDGKEISIYPSIGNIGTPCNSHYWIKRGQVDWSIAISPEHAEQKRTRDQQDVVNHVKTSVPNLKTQHFSKDSLWSKIIARCFFR